MNVWRCEKLKTEIRDQIENADWGRIAKQLTVYVSKRLAITFWASGKHNMFPKKMRLRFIESGIKTIRYCWRW